MQRKQREDQKKQLRLQMVKERDKINKEEIELDIESPKHLVTIGQQTTDRGIPSKKDLEKQENEKVHQAMLNAKMGSKGGLKKQVPGIALDEIKNQNTVHNSA